jgi:hypothetical protein
VSLLVCPYCYGRFKEKAIEFRCTGRPGKEGKPPCKTAPDPVLKRRIGDPRPYPPVFQANGTRLRVAHEDCGLETTTRVCPECHSRLPTHFGKNESRLIALVGAKYSGKTAYMTVLLHELKNSVGARFGSSLLGADDETRKTYKDRYESTLYDRHELLPPTQTAAARGVSPPLVFNFARAGDGTMRATEKRTVLSFFDTAGEDLNTVEGIEQNVSYLASADGIILLVDPLSMRATKDLTAPGAPRPDDADVESPLDVLTRITELLIPELKVKPGGKIDRPIALAFSKMDALWESLGEESPVRRPAPTTPAYESDDSLEVHEYIRALLDDWDGSGIDLALQRYWAKYRYFGLSALGAPPTEDGRLSTGVVQPHRVADPFLWLLSEFKAIPRTKPSKS